MGKEAIIERIESDARAEAEKILREAACKEEEILSAAREAAERERLETEAECAEEKRRILEGKAAAARLDSAKIRLLERRRAIEEIYRRALNELLSRSRHDSVALFEKLLKTYAEEGEEVVFARNFAYAEETAALSIVREKKLKISSERADIDGGFLLISEKCVKDLSFRTLLAEDREENESGLFERLFLRED